MKYFLNIKNLKARLLLIGNDSFFNVLLALTGGVTFVYSYLLALKRYNNFEFGKFDLGNMAQMVWNTSHGRFMEVTDQFGTNMPRWGMSHVDPILVVFAPLYRVIPNPMLLVGIQQVAVVSAIFPLFWLSVKLLRSKISAFWVILTYLLYPAVGYNLVWTGFHGISFVAPFFIWTVWYLDKHSFFTKKVGYFQYIVYWTLVILMLSGKEEVGSMLAIASFFLFLKNKKLAIKTFIFSFSWFIIAFFMIIPHYKHLRQESVDQFTSTLETDDIHEGKVTGDNFFIGRYSYLGTSYTDMLKTVVTKPRILKKEVFRDYKIKTFKYLLGPFGYISIISPAWIVGLPDILINVLSQEKIFDINNHRVGFISSTLFISYIYSLLLFMKLLEKQKKIKSSYIILFLTLAVFLNTFRLSSDSNNPLFVSGKSFITNKIVRRILADDLKGPDDSNMVVGTITDSKVPRNSKFCLSTVSGYVLEKDPIIYSGPDYLGAQTSNRLVNALFPSRIDDADLLVVDVFESKTLNPFGDPDWTLNKRGLAKLLESNNYRHVFSCDKLFVFEKGHTSDSIEKINAYDDSMLYTVDIKNFEASFGVVLPTVLYKGNNTNEPFEVIVKKESSGGFLDKVTFWEFRKSDNDKVSYRFIDYLSINDKTGIGSLKKGEYLRELYNLGLNNFKKGKYDVYYGVGDLLRAKKIYVGQVLIK